MALSRLASLFGNRKDVVLGIAVTLLGLAGVIGTGFLVVVIISAIFH